MNKTWSTQSGIGVAVLKPDRFVEQRAGDEPGFLITREFVLEAPYLRVNVGRLRLQYRDQYVRVEIARHPPLGGHSGFRTPYEGFSFADCDPIRENGTDVPVSWKGQNDLTALLGQPVYLRFEIRNMGIFSFRLMRDPGE